MRSSRAVPALVIASLLSACAAPPDPPAAGAAPELEGALWVLRSIEGAPAPPGVTLAFAGDEFRGAAPCNRYFGRFAHEGRAIEIGAIAATRRACPQIETERRYFAALADVALVERDGHDLRLLGPDSTPRLVFRDE